MSMVLRVREASKRLVVALACLGSLSAVDEFAALAHEGHDHGPKQPELPRVVAPRAETSSDDFELVAVRDGERMILYLDDFKTNTPVTDAQIEVGAGTARAPAKHVRDGIYEVPAPWLSKPGRHDMQISVQTAREADLLSLRFEVPQTEAPAATSASASRPWYAIGAPIVAAMVLLAWVLRRRKSRLGNSAIMVALALGMVAEPHVANANGAGSQQAAGTPNPVPASVPTVPVGFEPASRFADGSVFMSKAGQRIFAIRTVAAVAREEARAIELKGQVVNDPNAGGQVHAPIVGRLVPGPQGLPVLGATVTRGQALASIEPTVSALERAGIASQLAELAGQHAIVEARMKRYEQLEGSIARKEIDTTRAELAALSNRRATLDSALATREPLIAPVSGRIVMAAAIAGQITAARELLFVIADPARLMVEALAYDASLGARIRSATALTATGNAVELLAVGVGLQLRDQAMPLLFRVRAPAPPLAIGQPVRVLAATQERVSGIALSPEAVVRNAAGEPVVWVHIGAERFAERTVRIEQVRADLAIATAGINAGDRVVAHGATVLAQVR